MGPGTPTQIAARRTVPVLCYHQVREYTGDDGPGARPLICPPAVLQRQLEGLLEAGMHPVAATRSSTTCSWAPRSPTTPCW